MKLNRSSEEIENNSAAVFIVALQVLAWLVAVSYSFGDYSSSDSAGNGMSRGYAAIFITAPSMVFIFFCNVYLIAKKL